MEVLSTVLDDVLEASAHFGRKLVVEYFDAFLPVTEDDRRAIQISCHTCLVTLVREVLVGVARFSFADGPGKSNSFVVAIPCRKQMQISLSINDMLRKRSIHRGKSHSTTESNMQIDPYADKTSFKPATHVQMGPLTYGPHTCNWAH